jgi:hypothetical protein
LPALPEGLSPALGRRRLLQGAVNRRKDQISEIRSVNAATNLVIGIVNSYIGMKRQVILPLLNDLNETRERYAKHNEAVRSGGAPAPGPFHFNAEFRTFKPVQTPIEHLRDILFNKITSDNVMLALYQLLALAINDSCDMLNERNAVLEEFRKSPPDVTLVCFLGLPRRDGPVDERVVTGSHHDRQRETATPG